MSEPANGAALWLALPEGAQGPGGANPARLPAEGRWLLGSDEAADVRLSLPGVAPRHALLAPVRGGGWGLRSLVDAPLPTLNGRPVRTAKLSAGDDLALGEARLRLVAAPPDRAPRKPDFELPGFRIERQIGRGALARVYLAVQERLDRQVAIKVLRPDLCADADFVQRFQDEARAAAALHHTNVVTIFDVDEHEGRHFLVLEHMQRGSLEDRLLREGPLPWRAVLGVLRDAAAGLEYAAQKGLVHRDLKPANLMQNAVGVTKIADLGLATSAEAEASADGHARIVGTPHFMAPEQARKGTVDARADLYALGSSAYRLLTASTPFEGRDAREILRAKLTAEPTSIAERVPDLPADVARLVSDLMQRDVEARPPSARAVRERVEELIARHSEGVSPGIARRRRRAVATALATLVVSAAAAGGWWLAFGGGGEGRAQAGDSELVGERADVESAISGSGTEQLPNEPPLPPPLGADGPVGDEDARLRELEQRATTRLASALAQVDPEARELALRSVVAEFAGTDAARRAVDELAAAVAAGKETLAAPGADASWRAFLDDAERAASSAAGWLPPQQAIAALTAYEPPPDSVPEETFALERTRLVERARSELAIEAEQRFDRVRQDLEDGRFEAARAALGDVFGWLVLAPTGEDGAPSYDVPVFDAALADGLPPAVRELRDHTLRALAWRDELASLEQLRNLALRQADRRVLADLFAPPSDLLDRAYEQQREQVLDRLNATAARLETERLREPAGVVARAWREAGEARELLVQTFRDGEWRRSTILSPERRGGVEVVGFDGDEIVTRDERIDLLAYSALPEMLDHLFRDRLDRDYSAAERSRVAGWIFWSSLCVAAESLGARLAGSPGTSGLPEPDLWNGFELIETWVGGSDLPEDEQLAALAQRCTEATRLLQVGLRRADQGDAVYGAWSLEQVLEEYTDTPIVWFVSSGTPLAPPVSWPEAARERLP